MPSMPGRRSGHRHLQDREGGALLPGLRVSLSWLEENKRVISVCVDPGDQSWDGGHPQENTVLLSATGDKMDKHSECTQHTRYRMVLLPILTLSRCPTYPVIRVFFFNKLKISKIRDTFLPEIVGP